MAAMAKAKKMTRKRQRRKSGNASRRSVRPKSAEKRSTARWRRSAKRCDKILGTK